MASIKMIIMLTFVVLVSGNPESLLELYGTPSHDAHVQSRDYSDELVNTKSQNFASGSGSLSNLNSARSGQILNIDSEGNTLTDSSNINQINEFVKIRSNDNSVVDFSSGSPTTNSLFRNTGDDQSSSVTGIGGIQQNEAVQKLATGFLDSTLITEKGLNRIDNNYPVTVTEEITVDFFKTLTNVIYNSIPVTLTQFLKTTLVSPTVKVLSTEVDDRVFVATAPVTRTDTITVTDTTTNFQCATEVSTDFYTITHRAYDIRQQVVTSTISQTKVFHPTVVSTLIKTEYETETAVVTVTNTVFIEPRVSETIRPNVGFGGQFRDGTFGDRSFGQVIPHNEQFQNAGLGNNANTAGHYY